MTTGRINQVTIVRRGWPPALARSAGELVTEWRSRERAGHSAVGRAASAAHGNPPSPSQFPRASFHHTGHWVSVRLGRPRRRAQRPASTMAVSAARGDLPLLSGRFSHRPAIHRTHPAPARSGLSPDRASPVRRAARDRLRGGRRPL